MDLSGITISLSFKQTQKKGAGTYAEMKGKHILQTSLLTRSEMLQVSGVIYIDGFMVMKIGDVLPPPPLYLGMMNAATWSISIVPTGVQPEQELP